ncbi:hypothetical protein ACFPJ4_14140 [Lysinimonas soli]|uniref:DUF5648 domain-containing protein n=1 Tax=Lysinimonas soli TaxID=1074233 RepID=A0ABW0NSK3_9MICO
MRSILILMLGACLAMPSVAGAEPANGSTMPAVRVSAPVPAPGTAPSVSPTIALSTSETKVVIDSSAGVYYTTDHTGVVEVVDLTTHAIMRAISVPGDPNALAFDSETHRLYVGELGGSKVWVINPSTGTILGALSGVPSETVNALLVNTASGTIYSYTSNNPSTEPGVLTAFDGQTLGAIASTLTVGAVEGLAIDRSRGTLDVVEYDAYHLNASIAVLHGSTLAVKKRTYYGSAIRLSGIDVDPLTNTLYVGFSGGDSYGGTSYGIYGVDGSTGAVTSTMLAYDDAQVESVYIDESRSLVYGLSSTSAFTDPAGPTGPGVALGMVSVFSAATKSFVEELQVGAQSFVAGLDTMSGNLHVINFNHGNPSVNVITPLAEQNVFRFWLPSSNDHFFTMNVTEAEGILRLYPSLWRYEGVAYQAFATQESGTVPLYRFWSPDLQGHFFTASQQERDAVVSRYASHVWSYEGVDFYVYPEGTSAAATTQVARFWSPRYQQHFYTMNPAETAYIEQYYAGEIWTFENYNFRVPSS